jgi:hypothetical protein
VFPHVLAVGGGDVLIGSRDPLPSGSATWLARLRQASVYLGPSEAEVLVEALTTARFLPNSPVSAQALNRDLFPRDEFASR